MFVNWLNKHSLLNSKTFWTLTIIYAELKYNEFWGEVWVPSQAYFFQNNCHYMMAIYTVSNLD